MITPTLITGSVFSLPRSSNAGVSIESTVSPNPEMPWKPQPCVERFLELPGKINLQYTRKIGCVKAALS
jgi:hypothetical protein